MKNFRLARIQLRLMILAPLRCVFFWICFGKSIVALNSPKSKKPFHGRIRSGGHCPYGLVKVFIFWSGWWLPSSLLCWKLTGSVASPLWRKRSNCGRVFRDQFSMLSAPGSRMRWRSIMKLTRNKMPLTMPFTYWWRLACPRQHWGTLRKQGLILSLQPIRKSRQHALFWSPTNCCQWCFWYFTSCISLENGIWLFCKVSLFSHG